MGRCYIFVYTFGVCKIRHRNSRKNKLFRILKSLIVYISRTLPVAFNQNLFYQNASNLYPSPTSHQLTAHGMQSNAHQQSGTQPNLTQQGYQSNRGHCEENTYHQL